LIVVALLNTEIFANIEDVQTLKLTVLLNLIYQ